MLLFPCLCINPGLLQIEQRRRINVGIMLGRYKPRRTKVGESGATEDMMQGKVIPHCPGTVSD